MPKETHPQLVSSNLKKLTAFEMHYSGSSYEEIAAKLEAPVATVSTYFSREWKNDYKAYQGEQNLIRQRIALSNLRSSLEKATRTLANLLDSRNEKVRLAASKEILDRALGKPEVANYDASARADPLKEILKRYRVVDEDGRPIDD